MAILEDHTDEVLEAMNSACAKALELMGEQAVAFAQDLAPYSNGGGHLQGSITHQVTMDGSDKHVDVGTNMFYAPYQEYGTGIYAAEGNGRQTPWVYKDDNDKWHYTHGNVAKPFIKPAVADHQGMWKKILEDTLKGG